MDEQQKQTILDLPKVIAVGIASPVATILTSRFGVTGTLIGLALSAVILTVLVDLLKVYLARAPATVAKVPHTVAKMPGGLRTHLSWHNIHARLRTVVAKFSLLPPAPARRAILIGSVVAAGISFLVGLSIVTALELGVGRSLSCWVWEDCPAGSSTDDGGTSMTSTLPSILGGGRDLSSVAPEGEAPSLRQPTPNVPGVPSQPEDVWGGEQPGSAQPDQRWSPSVVPEEGDQRPSSPQASEEGNQRPSWSESSEENEQLSPADGSEEAQQQEDQRKQSSSGSDRQTRKSPIPSVPWTT